MTRDFRNVGRITTPTGTAAAGTPEPLPGAVAGQLAANQRIVVAVVYFAAAGFLVAGIWLLSGRSSPLPERESFFLGIAFVVAAISDAVIVQILKRVWRGPPPPG